MEVAHAMHSIYFVHTVHEFTTSICVSSDPDYDQPWGGPEVDLYFWFMSLLSHCQQTRPLVALNGIPEGS